MTTTTFMTTAAKRAAIAKHAAELESYNTFPATICYAGYSFSIPVFLNTDPDVTDKKPEDMLYGAYCRELHMYAHDRSFDATVDLMYEYIEETVNSLYEDGVIYQVILDTHGDKKLAAAMQETLSSYLDRKSDFINQATVEHCATLSQQKNSQTGIISKQPAAKLHDERSF